MKTSRACWSWLVSIVLAAASNASAAGTLVVKYTAAVTACAETAFARGEPFVRITPDDSLDALHATLDVIGIRALFQRCDGLGAAEASARWRDRMAHALARNPGRAARARGPLPDLSRIYRVTYAADLDPDEAAARYAANRSVAYAHPDQPLVLAHIPNDPYFAISGSWPNPYGAPLDDLWNLKRIGGPAAWDVTMGAGSIIAVVDTGIDRTHPDIAANIWSNPGEIPNNGIDDDGNGFVDDTWGWDFVDNDANPRDTDGHGTHVAGIAAAIGDNGIGILGVAPAARLMAVRLFDHDGGRSGDAAAAIVYAAENGADVINNSWALRAVPGAGSALDDAVDTALALGAVVVFAGGNSDFTISATPWWHHPRAITVGNADEGDGAFSATDADVSAPGDQILSLRSGTGIDGPVVGTGYVVGSGTSMAAPHVAGAAALLLSVFPGLSPLEVKWRLETAAAPTHLLGWEGLPWNPYGGWGRLDLDGIFDPTPATTRLDRLTTLERHEFVDRISDPAPIGHTFTTAQPVAWSITVPAWAAPSSTAGAGDGAVALTFDASAVGVGVHEGVYQLAAPGTVDGGAALPLRLNGYPDLTLADTAVLLHHQRQGLSLAFGVTSLASVGSPTRTLLAWGSLQEPETRAVTLDRGGATLGSSVLHANQLGDTLQAAFDGRHFAVIWLEYDASRRTHLMLSRLAADGSPLDPSPQEIWATSRWWMEPRIAFDGTQYVIVWTQYSTVADEQILALRMGADFAIETKPRLLYKGPVQTGLTSLACGTGHCLLVWQDHGGSSGTVTRAQRFVDGSPVGVAFDLPASAGFVQPAVASSGDAYLGIVGTRETACGPTDPYACAKGLLAVRVDATGNVLDSAPTEIATAPADTPFGIVAGPMGFDGAAYVVPYTLTNRCAAHRCSSAVLAARVAVDGTLLDGTSPGHAVLVDPSRERMEDLPVVATAADHVALAWQNYPRDPLTTIATELSVEARTLPPSQPADVPPRAVGAVGPVTLAEGEDWTVRLSAPGLSPSTLRFTAENLPDGADVDPVGGILHWRPGADQAGAFPAVRVVADDGTQQLAETVPFTVTNVTSSISGTVRASDGSAVGGVGIDLVPSPARATWRRTGSTTPDGRFVFVDLPAAKYRLRLTRAAHRQWHAPARRVTLLDATADVTGVDLVVTPH